MTALSEADAQAQTPCGLNHLVLNVRDLEASHRFWTDLIGFRQVGTLRPVSGGTPRPRMRFYSGEVDGTLRHHDIALVEQPMLASDPADRPRALNHVAIAYPTYEAWQRQIAFLTGQGVVLFGRVDRGVTNSIHLHDPDGCVVELVYELPRALWQDDIETALNQAVEHPIGRSPPVQPA
jgi:catechol 2,3-dioxygenase